MKGLLNKTLVVIFFVVLLPAYALGNLIINHPVGGNNLVGSGSGSGSGTLNPSIAPNRAKMTSCEHARDYLSWNLLETIMYPKESFRVEKIIKGDKVDLQVFIPSHPKYCLELDVEIDTIKKPSKLGFYTKIKNNFFKNNPLKVKELFGVKGSDGQVEMKKLTQEQRLTKCLESYGEKNSSGDIYLTLTQDDYVSFDGPFHLGNPVKVDDVNNVLAYIKSPNAGLKERKIQVRKVTRNEDKCFTAENFNLEDLEEPIYDSRYLADLMNLKGCDGTEECVQRHMSQFFKIFQDEDLISELSKEHIKFLEEKLFGDDGYKDIKNVKEKIEEIVKKLGDLAEDLLEADSEDMRDSARKYDKLRNKLKSKYIEPLRDIIEIKNKMYNATSDEDEKEQILESIEQLNELIGMYADGDARTEEVVVKLATQNFTDIARKAGELYHVSALWSDVKPEGDNKLTPTRAKRRLKTYLKDQKKNLAEAKEIYMVKKGKKIKTPALWAKMQSSERGFNVYMKSQFKKEQDMAKGCQKNWYGVGQKDKAKCDRYQKNYSVRKQQRDVMTRQFEWSQNKMQRKMGHWKKYEVLGAENRRAEREESQFDRGFYDGHRSSMIDFGLFGDDIGVGSDYPSMDYYDDYMYSDNNYNFDYPQEDRYFYNEQNMQRRNPAGGMNSSRGQQGRDSFQFPMRR